VNSSAPESLRSTIEGCSVKRTASFLHPAAMQGTTGAVSPADPRPDVLLATPSGGVVPTVDCK
jgi:hypothetical protein